MSHPDECMVACRVVGMTCQRPGQRLVVDIISQECYLSGNNTAHALTEPSQLTFWQRNIRTRPPMRATEGPGFACR